jgi:hypothetical protein
MLNLKRSLNFPKRSIDKLTPRVPLLEQELLTLPEHLISPPVFSGVPDTRSLVLCVMFCRSLFVLLSFFFWPLCCLSFIDLRILITPYVSSNSSYMTIPPIALTSRQYWSNVCKRTKKNTCDEFWWTSKGFYYFVDCLSDPVKYSFTDRINIYVISGLLTGSVRSNINIMMQRNKDRRRLQIYK